MFEAHLTLAPGFLPPRVDPLHNRGPIGLYHPSVQNLTIDLELTPLEARKRSYYLHDITRSRPCRLSPLGRVRVHLYSSYKSVPDLPEGYHSFRL